MPSYFENEEVIIPFDKVLLVRKTAEYTQVCSASTYQTIDNEEGVRFVKEYTEWLHYRWKNEVTDKLEELSQNLNQLKNYFIFR